MVTARHGLTLQQFLALPEEKPALQYIDGRIVQKVAPKVRHSRLQTKLPEIINQFAEPREIAAAFGELRTTFSGRSYVPDVTVFRWERLPVDADGELLEECLYAADIAIEIVSPGQSVAGLAEQCAWYVANGVRLAFLINPRARWVRRYRPGEPAVTLRGDDLLAFDDIVPGFTLRVNELFGWLRMPRRA